MTSEQKNKLHQALMEGAEIYLGPHTLEWKLFEVGASENLARIEPLLDDMLRQAENRGRLAVYLEAAAKSATWKNPWTAFSGKVEQP